jgi:hypothetical protein
MSAVPLSQPYFRAQEVRCADGFLVRRKGSFCNDRPRYEWHFLKEEGVW